MLALLLLVLVSTCYGRSLKYLEPPKRLGRHRDDHGCLTSAGFVYCDYSNKCIRIQDNCTPPVPTLEKIIEPEIKPTTRPFIKQNINVYEIEI